jgi:hypothetical protein
MKRSAACRGVFHQHGLFGTVRDMEDQQPGGPVRRYPCWIGVVLLLACGTTGDDGVLTPPPNVEPTDVTLSALATESAGWTYYKNRADTLLRSVGSGHVEARLRTRFNARAATQLDAAGKVRVGSSFPDSSLVVKELIIGGVLSRYAVMYKLRGSSNAGTGGWLWAYYAPDGATQIGIAGRGGACQSCHASGVDHVRMNDSHP